MPDFEPATAVPPSTKWPAAANPLGKSAESVISARRSAVNQASQEHDALEVTTAPAAVHGALRSPGEPLEAGVRSSFENSMGQDFSRVRVHSDQVAATAAVQAQAFTFGHHIVVRHRLDPRSPSDDRLVAHELVHVVDQRAGAARSRRVLQRQHDDDDDRAERAQEKAATQQRKQERANAGKDLDQLAGAEAERELRALESEYRQEGAQQRSVARKAADLERYRKLLTRIPGTSLEKSQRQGAFDELQRTPATTAGKPQDKYVAGGRQLPGQELRPGRDSYAQPDYSMYRRDAQGNLVRIHVNLKSDDLNKLSPAQARARGVAYHDQAVRNSGHLAEGEGIVISFAQNPSKDVQEAINQQLFKPASPVKEVRYGTTTHRAPTSLIASPPVAQTAAPKQAAAPKEAVATAPQQTAKPATAPEAPVVKPTATAEPPVVKPTVTPKAPVVKPAVAPTAPWKAGLKAGGKAAAWMIVFAALDYALWVSLQEQVEQEMEKVSQHTQSWARREKAENPEQPVYITWTVRLDNYQRFFPLVGWVPDLRRLMLAGFSIGVTRLDTPSVDVQATHDLFYDGETRTTKFSELLIP